MYIHKDVKKRKQYLKKHGLADASIKECMTVKFDEAAYAKKQTRLAEETMKKMWKDNVAHAVPQFFKDMGVIKK